MSELQATVEFSVELYKFYNVDLFQRGFYQIRTSLRLSPKLPVKVETTLPKSQRTDFVFPACVVNGAGVSKTFQILYRNEEVLLDDVVVFRAHILVDSHKIEDTLERADFTLSVELWFTDQAWGAAADQQSAISCVSARTLQLRFSPTRGLHYHLPVLFDYFHLAAVTLTVHGSLVALHQPYINTPRSAKPWLGSSQKPNLRTAPASVETALFLGPPHATSTARCAGGGGGTTRLAHARHTHAAVCAILLASYEQLRARLDEYARLLPAWQQAKMETADCFQRFSNLSDLAKECHRNLLATVNHRSSNNHPESHWNRLRLVEVEEEFVALANSDIAQLCAEHILLWQQFLDAFTLKHPVHQHLAQAHHHLRARRFAEAFFVLDNPRQSAAGCYDANYQNYLTVSDMVRRSRYLATLPPLPVQCLELDGDLATMPIIFEDQYQDVAEFARRRSVAGRKAESDPFLNVAGVDPAPKPPAPAAQQLATTTTAASHDDCSCGIAAILESRSSRRDVVTATLTLDPRGGGSVTLHHTLPARHSKSKSLDQLRTGEAETLPSRKKSALSPVSSSAPNPSLHRHPQASVIARSSSSQLRRDKSLDAVLIPPRLPVPLRNNLKEKLKNSLRLELKVANGNGVLTSPSTDSNDSGDYRRLEQSASVPFDLAQAERDTAQCGAVANGSESMPNIAAAAMSPGVTSPVAVVMDLPSGLPANDKAKLEIGMYGSTDAALISVDTSLAEVLRSLTADQAPRSPSSSLSEITSEQSGWVSNSSRRTSGDMSSGQLSPESERGLTNGKVSKPRPVKPPRTLNDTQLLDRLTKLAEPPAEHTYEELHVPPPTQFRDVPPPPEPFRDHVVPESRTIEPIDNLLYHVYESVKEVERQSNNKNRQRRKEKLEAEALKKTPSPKPDDVQPTPAPNATATTPGSAQLSCECYADPHKQAAPLRDDAACFTAAKDDFKRQMNFTGMIYSDLPTLASTLPYFHISDEYRMFSPEGLHLIVCVHGLDGNSADLRLVKTYLELGLPGANLEFLMSERNQGDTFSDFDTMTDKLVAEILYHVEACGLNPTKISFVGHSLGNIIIRSAITRPQMKHLLPRLHTFLSLSGPHLGTLYNNSGLVNMGMWFMQKWKKSGSLLQLALRDNPDVRQTFLYRLSQRSNLQHFRNLLLCGSSQDRYVPLHSARIELCKAAVKDSSVQGAAYREMVHNILYPIIGKPEVTFVRYDVHHALPNTANSLIGRAAHIAVLDSELFIEKFLVVTGLKYFR